MIQRILLLLLFCVTSYTANSGDTIVGKQAYSFSLADQFEKTWSWKEHYQGKTILLFICDRKGRDYLENWLKPLRTALGTKAEYVAIADVSAAPFFLKGFIRGKIRDAHSYPILLDWEGDVCEYYNFTEDLTTAVLIDKNNIVRFSASGKGTTEEVQRAVQEVKKLVGI